MPSEQSTETASAEQEAMLERLCRKYFFTLGALHGDHRHENDPSPTAMEMLRELLLAVQEADAAMVDEIGVIAEEEVAFRIAKTIRQQTYGNLFPEEE